MLALALSACLFFQQPVEPCGENSELSPLYTLIAILAIFFILVLAIIRGSEDEPDEVRTRYIPKRVKNLAWAKFVQEFYADPDNEGRPLRRADYEFDHKIPFSRGGTNDLDNIRVITRKENRAKSDKME